MKAVRASLALVLVATLAQATTIRLSGFDGSDNVTGSGMDSWEFTETLSGGAADADIGLQTTTVHDDANGGSSSSRKALQVTVTSGEGASYAFSTDFAADDSITMALSANLATAPSSGERAIAGFLEGASDPGCFLTVNASRQLTLYYGSTATTWGTTTTSGGALKTGACSSNPNLPCTTGTVSSDCPASDTCTKVYWAGLELTQVISSSTAVLCELRQDGLLVFTGVKTISGGGVARVVNVGIGAPTYGSATANATLYLDDLVVDDSGSRAGFGYVATKYPATAGATTSWGTETCKPNGGTFPVQCINDYNESADSYAYYVANDQEDNVKTSNSGKVEEFSETTPSLTLRTGETATAVEVLTAGRTNTTNATRQLQSAILVCPPAACQDTGGDTCGAGEVCTCANAGADGLSCTADSGCCVRSAGPVVTITTASQVTSPKLWTRYLAKTSPVSGTSWTEVVNTLGLRFQSGPSETQSTRVGAAWLYVRVQKPDTAEAITLLDHNKGTDDGIISIATVGDSTNAGTLTAQCQGGTSPGANCSQPTYCSWDATERDKPSGGCGGDNTACRTCTARRSAFNSGAGYACTANADCNLGTCTTSGCDNGLGHCCTGDPAVSCSVTADCDLGNGDGVANAGDCDTTATCVDSCPGGGTCPTGRVGWAGQLATTVGADVILRCGLGSEDTGQMVVNRFSRILDGKGENASLFGQVSGCVALQGTGKCTCASDADCGGGASSCAAGLCTSGTISQAKCTAQTACATGKLCQFAPPDYIVTLEGYNDHLSTTLFETGGSVYHDPQCSTPAAIAGTSSVQPPKWCPAIVASPSGYQCGQTACVDASVCGEGECMGRMVAADAPCVETLFGFACTMENRGCGSDLDCSYGQTCDGESPASPETPIGICRCASDAQCPGTASCVGPSGKKLCRRKCTTATQAADCGAQSVCDETTYSPAKVCKGRCNCPCQAISCTRDDQCGGTLLTQRTAGLRTRWYQGRCNPQSGKCWNCGQSMCAQLSDGPCSCSADADCGTGGACDSTRKICTAGDALKRACRGDLDCAAGKACLSAWPQFLNYRRGHQGLAVQVFRRMQDIVAGLGDSTPPVLLFAGLPGVGGLLDTGATLPDRSCYQFGSDREYNESIIGELLANPSVFPPDHVIDFRGSAYENQRFTVAEHVDHVHHTANGGAAIGTVVGATLNRLNVCRKTNGTVQRYCLKPNGSYVDTGCGNPATCPQLCDGDTDCAGAGRCVRRRCDGSGSNCPGASDVCGGD